jgi:hypothetical protein
MSTKSDILIEGMVHSTMSYAVCPVDTYHSVDIKILNKSKDKIDLYCNKCGHNFWKTKI